MGFKDWMQRRVEKDSVVSELNGERVILKRGSILAFIPIIGDALKDWKRVYPPIDENGNYKWFNIIFGGGRNFFYLIVILLLLGFLFIGIRDITSSYSHIVANPCVQECINKTYSSISNPSNYIPPVPINLT
jgi:hypothetical protein